nr:GNAT family N-acetyltransferase [Roseomonas acroporae]
MPPGLRIDVEDAPAAADLDRIPEGLEAFNEAMWPGHQPFRPLGVFVRDAAGKILGGLAGGTYGGWLYVRHFWVSEPLRGRGLGREMLARAERRALARGSHSVWLDTFSFQAPEFYRRQGYEVFGELDVPPGYKRIFLRKALATRDGGGAAATGADGPA